jgi:hypothetical protein
MHILTTSTADQTIKIASRRNIVGDLRLVLINKSTREQFDYTGDFQWQLYLQNPEGAAIKWDGGDLVPTQGDIFLQITNQYALKEGDYYTLKLIDDNGEVYRDIIFCTDQTDYNKYNPNKDKYTEEDSFDDSYIIL